MHWTEMLALFMAAGVVVYLVVAMLLPEKLS